MIYLLKGYSDGQLKTETSIANFHIELRLLSCTFFIFQMLAEQEDGINEFWLVDW